MGHRNPNHVTWYKFTQIVFQILSAPWRAPAVDNFKTDWEELSSVKFDYL